MSAVGGGRVLADGVKDRTVVWDCAPLLVLVPLLVAVGDAAADGVGSDE